MKEFELDIALVSTLVLIATIVFVAVDEKRREYFD